MKPRKKTPEFTIIKWVMEVIIEEKEQVFILDMTGKNCSCEWYANIGKCNHHTFGLYRNSFQVFNSQEEDVNDEEDNQDRSLSAGTMDNIRT